MVILQESFRGSWGISMCVHVSVLIPFFAFVIGCTLDPQRVAAAGLLGLALGVVLVFVSAACLIPTDRLIGGDGTAGVATANQRATPRPCRCLSRLPIPGMQLQRHPLQCLSTLALSSAACWFLRSQLCGRRAWPIRGRWLSPSCHGRLDSCADF